MTPAAAAPPFSAPPSGGEFRVHGANLASLELTSNEATCKIRNGRFQFAWPEGADKKATKSIAWRVRFIPADNPTAFVDHYDSWPKGSSKEHRLYSSDMETPVIEINPQELNPGKAGRYDVYLDDYTIDCPCDCPAGELEGGLGSDNKGQ